MSLWEDIESAILYVGYLVRCLIAALYIILLTNYMPEHWHTKRFVLLTVIVGKKWLVTLVTM